MPMLQCVHIDEFTSERGQQYNGFSLSYEVAGCPLGTAPIVLVNHALTGNSSVAGEQGWWGSLIGPGKAIDTIRYTIFAFNIPGNGYDGGVYSDPEQFTLCDVAHLFVKGLQKLGISALDAIIGASMGGALTWQMAYLYPTLARRIFPIACDYKASDWLIAQTYVQQLILAHSNDPLRDARVHAMLCYRTPPSLNQRFGEQSNPQSGRAEIIEWLTYHGTRLSERFTLSAYQVMTYLTATIRVCSTVSELAAIKSAIHLVSIDSDLLFTHDRSVELYRELSRLKPDTTLSTLHSIHGHDAFLMEYEQLNRIIAPYFKV